MWVASRNPCSFAQRKAIPHFERPPLPGITKTPEVLVGTAATDSPLDVDGAKSPTAEAAAPTAPVDVDGNAKPKVMVGTAATDPPTGAEELKSPTVEAAAPTTPMVIEGDTKEGQQQTSPELTIGVASGHAQQPHVDAPSKDCHVQH